MGERFAIVLPRTPILGTQKVAIAIGQEIADLKIPHVQSWASDRITVSIGISSIVPQQDISVETLIATADKAMYNAKQAGRNRYCIYGQPLS
jgi:diguanylate cyclase (GGDEF)-like protein